MAAVKRSTVAVPATFLAIFLASVTSLEASSPIPADPGSVNGWFASNVKAFNERKSSLDPAVVVAENGVKVINVMKDGSGDFKTVTDAVKSIPSGNTNRTIVHIGPGVYNEKIVVDRTKPFVTFYGSSSGTTTFTYAGTAAKYGTLDSATVAVESDYFVAVNIIFENSSPAPDGNRAGAQAVAMRISGDKAAFYNCKFKGFQDTLCDDKGNHFFKGCFIQGTVDFIFGNGRSIYLSTELHTVATDINIITAQARELPSDDTGYIFVHCKITGTGNTLLGRAWKARARAVFAYTNMGNQVSAEGWSDRGNEKSHSTVYFGEYKSMGSGSSTAKRASYAKMLADKDIQPFLSTTFIQGDKWLLPPPKL